MYYILNSAAPHYCVCGVLLIDEVPAAGLLGGFLVGITLLVMNILKNSSLAEGVVKYLVEKIDKIEIVDFDELKNHNYIIKLTAIKDSPYLEAIEIIKSAPKKELFLEYVRILAEVGLESSQRYLNKSFLDKSPQEVKAFVSKELTWRTIEYDKRLTVVLMSYNNDKEKVNTIVRKMASWRSVEHKVIVDHISSIISLGNKNLVPYFFDAIFNTESIGFDLYLTKGADSFNLLNGELEEFLKK